MSLLGFPGGSVVKKPPANVRRCSFEPLGWEDSPGEGNGNTLQYFCLENPIDTRAWCATVPGVAKSCA